MTTSQSIVRLADQLVVAGLDYQSATAGFRRAFLQRALSQHGGNLCRTARELHLHRNTLLRMCHMLGINLTALRLQLTLPNRKRRPPTSEHGVRLPAQGLGT